jgi:hypothetical protein
MTDLDPRIGELLEARTPQRAVTRDWNAVLLRAGMSGARRRRRRPSPGWLLLAAALIIPAGLAVAKAGQGVVHYLSGPATPAERAIVRPLNRSFAGTPGVHGDLARARQLVSIGVGGHRYVFVMVPLTDHASGGCFYEIVDRHSGEEKDCGFDPQDRHPRRSPPRVVGAGTALGAEDFRIAQRPIWVVLGDMPDRVRSVVVHFQDGSTVRAPTNGRFFGYVVQGTHVTDGHRPTALVGLTASGQVRAVQLLYPDEYNVRAEQEAALAGQRLSTSEFLEEQTAHAVPLDQIRAIDRVATTPEKVAEMFGGRPQSYPRYSVVVLYRGPFTITTRPRGCVATSEGCTPRGHWAYVAFVLDPDRYHGGPEPPGLVRWLRKAPLGMPHPHLRRLGHVFHDPIPRT